MPESIPKIFVTNFLRFDFLIFVLAILNILLFVRAKRQTKRVIKQLNPEGYIPGGWEDHAEIRGKYREFLSLYGERKLLKQQKQMNLSYTLYENITAVFPLMGILGTVISLIPMVKEIETLQTGLFFAALTSTFWGIVFAIIFKSMNGFLQADLEFAEDQIAVYLERNSERVMAEERNGGSREDFLGKAFPEGKFAEIEDRYPEQVPSADRLPERDTRPAVNFPVYDPAKGDKFAASEQAAPADSAKPVATDRERTV